MTQENGVPPDRAEITRALVEEIRAHLTLRHCAAGFGRFATTRSAPPRGPTPAPRSPQA